MVKNALVKTIFALKCCFVLNSFGKKRKGRRSYTSAHVKRPNTLCIHNTKYI